MISKCIIFINVCVLDVIPSCSLKVTHKWLNRDSNQRFEFCLNYARASLLTTAVYSVSVYSKIPEEAGWHGSRMLLEGWPPMGGGPSRFLGGKIAGESVLWVVGSGRGGEGTSGEPSLSEGGKLIPRDKGLS